MKTAILVISMLAALPVAAQVVVHVPRKNFYVVGDVLKKQPIVVKATDRLDAVTRIGLTVATEAEWKEYEKMGIDIEPPQANGEKSYLLIYVIDLGCEPYSIIASPAYLTINTGVDTCARRYMDTVTYFESAQEAVKFINNDFPTIAVMSYWWGFNESNPPKFDRKPRLYRIAPVPIRSVKVGEYEDVEMQPVKVKRDKKEWRIAE